MVKKYLKPYKGKISLYLLIYFIASLASITQVIVVSRGISEITLGNFDLAIKLSLVEIGIVIIKRLGWYISTKMYYKYTIEISAAMSRDLTKRLFSLNSETFSIHETGAFTQRICSDPIKAIENLSDLLDDFMAIVSSAIILIYIATLNFYIAIAYIVAVFITFLIQKKFLKIYIESRKKVSKKEDEVLTFTTEIVRSEKDIKTTGLEKELEAMISEKYKEYRKTKLRHSNIHTDFRSLRNTFAEVAGIGILILAIYFAKFELITLATYLIIQSNNKELKSLAQSLGEIGTKLSAAKISTSRMAQLFDEVEYCSEKFGREASENLNGAIEFRNVAYSYSEYKTEEDKLILVSKNEVFKNLSFRIEPNQTVAFVGESGSGKTTILNLIAKMNEVDGGEILIDNHNIKDLDKATLRRSISLVNQFPYIFDLSIRENLRLANSEATNIEMKEALRKASLLTFVENLKDGLDTNVGESGTKLSGGQKQRLAIARALLRNSSVIMFDESTSALDNFTQNEIKETIDGLKGAATVIIVAHRLSTIKNVDKIFFLDKGEIVDSGTFKELFKNNSKFRKLFESE